MAMKRILRMSVVITVIACGVLYGQRALVSAAPVGEENASLSQLGEPDQVSADTRRSTLGGDGRGHPSALNGPPLGSRSAAQSNATRPTEPLDFEIPHEYYLEIGPVAGLTTAWHRSPDQSAIPRGSTVQFRVILQRGTRVAWFGAVEVYRDGHESRAACEFNKVGQAAVRAEVGDAQDGPRLFESVFDVVETAAADITITPPQLWVEPVVIDENLPEDELNEQTMSYFFGESIAALRDLGHGQYRTSTQRRVYMSAQADPPGFSPLIEWRLDGEAQGIGGAHSEVFLSNAAVHDVRVGPTDNPVKIEIEIYRVIITSHLAGQDIIPEGMPVTFTAITDPPGYEEDITWLATTKYGTGVPILGSGPTFTTQFDDTWGPHPGGGLWQWLGVKADNATAGQDQKMCAEMSDGEPCDDARFCTVDDVCEGGVCVGTLRDCSTENPCEIGGCDLETDRCVVVPLPDGIQCDVGLACDGGMCVAPACGLDSDEVCQLGLCPMNQNCDPDLCVCVLLPCGEAIGDMGECLGGPCLDANGDPLPLMECNLETCVCEPRDPLPPPMIGCLFPANGEKITNDLFASVQLSPPHTSDDITQVEFTFEDSQGRIQTIQGDGNPLTFSLFETRLPLQGVPGGPITMTATVMDVDGNIGECQVTPIVNLPPIPPPLEDIIIGCEPTGEGSLLVTFSVEGAVDPDGTVVDALWNFDLDAMMATGQGLEVSHEYVGLEPGDMPVMAIEIIDDCGGSTTITPDIWFLNILECLLQLLTTHDCECTQMNIRHALGGKTVAGYKGAPLRIGFFDGNDSLFLGKRCTAPSPKTLATICANDNDCDDDPPCHPGEADCFGTCDDVTPPGNTFNLSYAFEVVAHLKANDWAACRRFQLVQGLQMVGNGTIRQPPAAMIPGGLAFPIQGLPGVVGFPGRVPERGKAKWGYDDYHRGGPNAQVEECRKGRIAWYDSPGYPLEGTGLPDPPGALNRLLYCVNVITYVDDGAGGGVCKCQFMTCAIKKANGGTVPAFKANPGASVNCVYNKAEAD